MFTKEEATKERVAAYVAGLESEVAGYEARIKRLEGGRPDPLTDGVHARLTPKEAAAQIQDRIKQCRAEIARVKKMKPVASTDAEPVEADEES